MPNSSEDKGTALSSSFAALQHRPRPLPLFLELLRSRTQGDPDLLSHALSGLRRYQDAPRAAPPAPPLAIAERLGASLRDYGGSGPDILFVPSLINPPTVLDLGERSLLRWMAGQGRHVLLLDWGWPDDRRNRMGIAAHVEEILVPLMRGLEGPADLVGYCLGATMAVAAAQLGGARSLSLIAPPWHFDGFEARDRDLLSSLWRQSKGAAASLGVLPMEILQSAFWSLDPDRTVRKYADLAGKDEAELQAFVTLEDWANDGPPLSVAAARELFEDFFAANLPGSGKWRVAGETIDPGSLPCPVLSLVSTVDRIVPAASAPRIGERHELARGHVGMVIGSRAREELWEPLAAWLSRVSPTC
jgi:polyhydroxyalkanoate synthase